MVMSLQKSLCPLLSLSKILGICSFLQNPPRQSIPWKIYSLGLALGYTIYHIMASSESLSSDSNDTNFVTKIIESFNRYSGLICLVCLIIMSVLMQNQLVNVWQLIAEIDQMFAEKLNIVIDNTVTFRTVTLEMVVLIGTISTLEPNNCLMYVQTSLPLSENCLVMCLVPFCIVILTEIQFCAYLQILRNRLSILNKFLQNLGTTIKHRKNYLSMKHMDYIHLQTKNNNNNIGSGTIQSIIQIKHFFSFKKHENVKNKIQNVMEKPKKYSILLTDISICQIIFTKLEKLTEIINFIYGVPLAVILTIKFTTLTSLMYICCMLLIRMIGQEPMDAAHRNQLISSIGWISMQLFEIFTICFVCYITKNEALGITHTLHNFALSVNQIECKYKIKALSVQLFYERIKFCPLHLFELNLAFMHGLIGAALTYIIILIQFDIAQTQAPSH